MRTAEVVVSLCLATDLGMGFPFGFGLGSTAVAMRLVERLGVDDATAVQTYYGCLLFYAGCTADADVQADLFPDGLAEHWTPVMFASQRQSMAGVFRALGAGDGGRVLRTVRAAAKFPRAARGYQHHTESLCEVAEMLATGVSLPPTVSGLFRLLTERWDGGGPLGRAAGSGLPLAIRIAQVARDASFQRLRHGPARAVEVVRERAGGAFDPAVVDALSVDMLDESRGPGSRRGRRAEASPDTRRCPDRRCADGACRLRRPRRCGRALLRRRRPRGPGGQAPGPSRRRRDLRAQGCARARPRQGRGPVPGLAARWPVVGR